MSSELIQIIDPSSDACWFCHHNNPPYAETCEDEDCKAVTLPTRRGTAGGGGGQGQELLSWYVLEFGPQTYASYPWKTRRDIFYDRIDAMENLTPSAIRISDGENFALIVNLPPNRKRYSIQRRGEKVFSEDWINNPTPFRDIVDRILSSNS